MKILANEGEVETPDVYFTNDADLAQLEPFMRCAHCNADLCTVEEGDSLHLLLAVAVDHAGGCPVAPKT